MAIFLVDTPIKKKKTTKVSLHSPKRALMDLVKLESG